MSTRRVLTGPTLPGLEHVAFETLQESVGTHPDSILYLGTPEISIDEVRRRWTEYGPSACLNLTTFEGFVSDCYERDQYKGEAADIDRPLLYRLVELGIEEIDSPSNAFYTGQNFPREGVVNTAEDLYTNLEFAGLTTPGSIRRRLSKEGADSRADDVAELAEKIEQVRDDLLADKVPETYHSERMDHVINMDTDLNEVFPSVDAVVIGGFTHFEVQERELLQQIADTWPTVAIIPLQQEPITEVNGVDNGVKRAIEAFETLDFSLDESADSPIEDSSSRRHVAASLYRHPVNAPPTEDIAPGELGITILKPETTSDEIRHVARDLRAELVSATNATDVGVVLTNPNEYADQVSETFELYDIPFVVETELTFSESALGEVVSSICTLSREPRSVDTVLTLLTNPLVTLTDGPESLDHNELRQTAMRVDSTNLDTVLEHISDTHVATIESIKQDASDLAAIELEELQGHLVALLERLGVIEALNDEEAYSQNFLVRESDAKETLDRVLETLALTASVADATIGNPVDRLQRAIAHESIRRHGGIEDQRVNICGIAEAFVRDFDQIYILGLTASNFPSDRNLLAFAQLIYDAHPDLEREDPGQVARYQFGSLLASDASLQLSVPQRSQSGDPFVEADVITELGRVVDLSQITDKKPESPPGHREDVQQMIGDTWTEVGEGPAMGLVESTTEAGTFSASQHWKIKNGSECAAARAKAKVTSYDGDLSQDTVELVHPAAAREPYSPSSLETYAACGFKYYMDKVLDIDAPDSITREPGAIEYGNYIHEVLEKYYRRLQSEDGDPVSPTGDFGARQDILLDIALEQIDDTFEEFPKTAFLNQWLTEVLAGLGTPDAHRYYAPPGVAKEEDPLAKGLLYRFLENESDGIGKTTALPTWFEAQIGDPYKSGTPIGDGPASLSTPNGPVPVYGLVDRIDTVLDTEPTQLVVRDYKTGNSTPSENDTLLGLNFQLPLYALMAEDALDEVQTVGGAYYQVNPPNSVTSRSGLVTSQDMAAYYGSDHVDVPLLRFSYPFFETHEAFRQFVETVTPKRLGKMVEGIENGQFQPTILEPGDAGCNYCDYSHVCDVRTEQRMETIQKIRSTDLDIYVPPAALDPEPENVLEVS